MSAADVADALTASVLGFVAQFCGRDVTSIDVATTLFGDLGIDGADADAFFAGYAKRYGVHLRGLDLADHFGGEGLTPWAPLHWLARPWRRGSPERKADKRPIGIGELVAAARRGSWTGDTGP